MYACMHALCAPGAMNTRVLCVCVCVGGGGGGVKLHNANVHSLIHVSHVYINDASQILHLLVA